MKKTINQKKGDNMKKVDTTIYALIEQKDGSLKKVDYKKYKEEKTINQKKGDSMTKKNKYNQNDVYENNRYVVRADGSIRSDENWESKDTKYHVYAPSLKEARAKARKKINQLKEAA
jgi:hypothetical protein